MMTDSLGLLKKAPLKRDTGQQGPGGRTAVFQTEKMEKDQGTVKNRDISRPNQSNRKATHSRRGAGGTVRPRDTSALLRALGFTLESLYNEKITLAGEQGLDSLMGETCQGPPWGLWVWAAGRGIHPALRTGLGEREPKQWHSEHARVAESPRAWAEATGKS